MNIQEQMDYICMQSKRGMNFFIFFEEGTLHIHYLLNDEELYFEIRKGCPLEEHDEEFFTMIMLYDDIQFEYDPTCELNSLRAALDWGLNFIGNCSPQMLLLRLYFGFCTRGPYEKLAKTELTYIFRAFLQGVIREWEPGRSIREILHLPTNILRLFNSQHGTKHLITNVQRLYITDVYRRYHYLLNGRDKVLSEKEIQYLIQGHRHGHKITQDDFVRVNEISVEELELLKEYMQIYESVIDYYPSLPKYPSTDVQRYLNIARTVAGLKKNEGVINELLLERVSQHGLIGDFELLDSTSKFCFYSSTFKNCLFQYPTLVALSETDIIVLVLGDDICVELRKLDDDVFVLVQALTKCNKTLTKAQFDKLFAFCSENNILT